MAAGEGDGLWSVSNGQLSIQCRMVSKKGPPGQLAILDMSLSQVISFYMSASCSYSTMPFIH